MQRVFAANMLVVLAAPRDVHTNTLGREIVIHDINKIHDLRLFLSLVFAEVRPAPPALHVATHRIENDCKGGAMASPRGSCASLQESPREVLTSLSVTDSSPSGPVPPASRYRM